MSSLNLWSLSLVTESGTMRSVWVCLLCICPQIAAAAVRPSPSPPPLTSVNPSQLLHIALELGSLNLAMAASPVPGRGKHLPRCAGHCPLGMAQDVVFSILHKSKSLTPIWRGIDARAVPWCVDKGARGLCRVCEVIRMPEGVGRAMGEGSQKHGGGQEAGCSQGDQLRAPWHRGLLTMSGCRASLPAPCLRPQRDKKGSWEIRLGI